MLNRPNECVENGLVVAANNDRLQAIVQNHQEKVEVLAFELRKLDLVIRACRLAVETREDSLKKSDKQVIQKSVNVTFEGEDDLVEEPKEERNLVVSRALGK